MKKRLIPLVFLGLSISGQVFSATPEPVPATQQIYITATERNDFLKAAENGDLAKLKKMVEAMPEIIKTRDKDEWTALMYAARFGKVKAVEYLLTKGASVEETDGEGQTALHHAAWSGRKDVCEFLVKKGAKVNARTRGAVTPRRLAESNGHESTASYLKGKGGKL
ncbi:MAG: ankyrin repeat domain-containing protein [Candidatus Rifleibacteriota bacterium]